jgi:FkbM family methyltransferase
LFREYLTATADRAFKSIQLKFKIEDCVGRSIYKRGVYEPENSQFLSRYLDFSQPRVVFDVGANIGWYSVLLDKISSNGTVIYSFEPDEVNFGLLMHNLQHNRCARVVPVKKGLSDSNDIKKLYLYSRKNRGRHSLIGQESASSVDIETITLDSFTAEHNIQTVYFLKIDIEGWEYFAFQGGKNTLANTQHILMEYSPCLYEQHSPDQLLDLLLATGLKPHKIQDNDIFPVTKAQILASERQVDLFWTRG